VFLENINYAAPPMTQEDVTVFNSVRLDSVLNQLNSVITFLLGESTDKLNATVTYRLPAQTVWLAAKRYKVFQILVKYSSIEEIKQIKPTL
jgi:hypothetical protein